MAGLVEKWTRAKAIRVRTIVGKMNLCSCGTDAHWEVVLKLLEKAADHDKNGSFYGSAESDETKPWVEFGAKVLNSWELIEHGGGIGGAWLTDDGQLLLDFLRDFGTEDHDAIEGSGQPMWATEFSWDLTEDPHDSYGEWAQMVGDSL
jgi:hypothetical protein